ncbi:MAG TPA: glycosyltransferase family 39 protein [Gemmatimonadota bacterium]
MLGLIDLGGTGFWLDEAISVERAALPAGEFLEFLVGEAHQMKLYLTLLRGWRLLGESEVVIRGLSVLFSVASVVAIHALGARLYDRRTALIAALVLALNGFHLRYAQEARAYSLSVFLVIVSTLLLVVLLRRAAGARSSRTRWLAAAYGAVSGLAAYAHSFTVLVNAAHGAAIAALPRRAVAWTSLVLSAVVGGVILLPLAVHNAGDVGSGWSWIPEPTAKSVYGLFLHLTGYAGWPALLAYWVFAAAALAEPATGARASPGAPQAANPPAATDARAFARFRRALLLAWIVVPIGVVTAVSLVKPFLVPRYLIISLPPLVLLAARGLALIRRPVPFAAALAAFLWTAWPGIEFTYRKPWEEDVRGAAAHVFARAREGDGIVFYTGAEVVPFEWYRGRLGVASDAPPRVLHPGAGPLPQVLTSLPGDVSRVWLVVTHVPAGDATVEDVLDPRLRALYPSTRDAEFARVRVRLYGPSTSRSP